MALRCDRANRGATLSRADGIVRRWADPVEALAWLGAQCNQPAEPTGPPFKTGWVGFIGYDAGGLFESLPTRADDDLDVPLFEFSRHDQIDVSDDTGQIFAIDQCDEELPPLTGPVAPHEICDSPLSSNFTEIGYCQAVQRVIDYIRAGDVFQVNLSQRFTVGLGRRTAAQIYQRLLDHHPAWYGAYLNFGSYALLCNSPELFLQVRPTAAGRQIITRPIKGTRPLEPGMRATLEQSVKDQAELNMIVDLERNDLGRVCEIGSIRVTEPRVIESHSTVYHGAATIRGILKPNVGFADLLRAVFPGGSVTGAPKIRAMQIIDELEPVRRGPYCGAIGYLSRDGNMEFNVAIRTMIVERGRVHIPVGGGIVADSEPQAEYQETLVKARAMFAALGIPPASSGIDLIL